MDFGEPVVQDTPPPSGLQTLSQIMGLRQQQQQLGLQSQQLAVGQSNVQKAQEEMRERMMIQSALASGKTPDGQDLKGPDGKLNPEALVQWASTNAPLVGPGLAQNIIHTLHAKVQLNESIQNLATQNRNDVSGILRSAIDSKEPMPTIVSALVNYQKQNPSASKAISQATELLGTIPPNAPPQQRNEALVHMAMAFQLPGTTATQQTPTVENVTDSEGRTQLVSTNPYAPTPAGNPVGPPVVTGLAPSTLLTNPDTGEKYYKGPPGSTGTGGPAYPASMPAGGEQYASTLATQNATYLTDLTQRAAVASRNIGIFQTANEYAQNANMSVGQTSRTFIDGVFGLAGIPAAEQAKTSTDVLTKNLTMVLGGDTDLARQLAIHSSPNVTMTKEAYRVTSEEVIAQLQMVQKEQQYIQAHSQNPQEVQKARAEFAQINNPRLIQFMDRYTNNDVAGAKRILSGFSNKEQAQQFFAQAQWGIEHGIFPGSQ